jgi:hypothetical protein
MKKYFIQSLIIILAMVLIFPLSCFATENASVHVEIERPAGTFNMGDQPIFKGLVTNNGNQICQGLLVYVSLVSLSAGEEYPVDLEDWSAQKAVVINRLEPGETKRQEWTMRLIQSGRFGIILTVVAPDEKRPIVSDLIQFDVLPKMTISSARIIPVAAGEPLLLIALFALFQWRCIRDCSSYHVTGTENL